MNRIIEKLTLKEAIETNLETSKLKFLIKKILLQNLILNGYRKKSLNFYLNSL